MDAANLLTVFLFFIISICLPINAQSKSDYPHQVPGSCASNDFFDCTLNGDQCIQWSKVRDCSADCANGDDEKCGLNQLLCDETIAASGPCGKCVANISADSQCLDRRYARLCVEENIFKCVTNVNCVLREWVRDGEDDCGDNSDENPCFTGDNNCDEHAECSVDINGAALCSCQPPYYGPDGKACLPDPLLLKMPGNCSSKPMQFQCAASNCIAMSKFQDCQSDCPDGSDETCFTGTVKCSDGCTCVSDLSKCPGIPGSGQKICLDSGTVSCGGGSDNCVYVEWLMDGKNDCGNYGDEDACLQNKDNCDFDATCTSNPQQSTFKCKCNPGFSGNGTFCVGSDGTTVSQKEILDRLPGTCSANPLQFDCIDSCISGDKFRDCKTDCADGLDEACWSGQVKCDNCKCVDEREADKLCLELQGCSGRFKCLTGGGCILDEAVLDGVADCADNSDEDYCSKHMRTCPTSSPCVYLPSTHNFTCGCPTLFQSDGKGKCKSAAELPHDCAQVQYTDPQATSGVYTVYPINCMDPTRCAKKVLCDFDTDQGGWTVIQQRISQSENFWRNWEEYKNGFGSVGKDGTFWIGNGFLYQLSSLVEADGDELVLMLNLTHQDGNISIIQYDKFSVTPENHNYTVSLGSMVSGNVDNMRVSNGQPFGTFDRDTDLLQSVQCGTWWESGWWFHPNCDDTGNLNVPYTGTNYGHLRGIRWPGTSFTASIKTSRMQVRPSKFEAPVIVIIGTPNTTEKSQNQVQSGCDSNFISLYTISLFLILLVCIEMGYFIVQPQ